MKSSVLYLLIPIIACFAVYYSIIAYIYIRYKYVVWGKALFYRSVAWICFVVGSVSKKGVAWSMAHIEELIRKQNEAKGA